MTADNLWKYRGLEDVFSKVEQNYSFMNLGPVISSQRLVYYVLDWIVPFLQKRQLLRNTSMRFCGTCRSNHWHLPHPEDFFRHKKDRGLCPCLNYHRPIKSQWISSEEYYNKHTASQPSRNETSGKLPSLQNGALCIIHHLNNTIWYSQCHICYTVLYI